MVTKTLKDKSKVGSVRDLRQYTQQIWLAGLGAFSRAEEEGGKLFDSLVKVGEDLEGRTRELADAATNEVRVKFLDKASDTKEKVEKALDERVIAALSRVGLATQKDIEQVNQRMDDLIELLKQVKQDISQLK
jgi:poly(hydroxyalkanoate) granule-associated protein